MRTSILNPSREPGPAGPGERRGAGSDPAQLPLGSTASTQPVLKPREQRLGAAQKPQLLLNHQNEPGNRQRMKIKQNKHEIQKETLIDTREERK